MSTRRYKAHPQSAAGDFYIVNDECIDRPGPDYCEAVPASRPASVNRGPPPPPTFVLIATGRSPPDRMITALKSMATLLSRKAR